MNRIREVAKFLAQALGYASRTTFVAIVLLIATGFGVLRTPSITACSAILDTSASQCTTDADCAKFNKPGTTYSCISNGCSIPPPTVDSGVKECETNAECIAKLGDFTICKKSNNTCQKLLTPDCPKVLGKDNWKSDDAVILGSILPIIGPDQSGGLPLENAIEIAVSDFTQGAQGLPPKGGPNRRPIAVVSCSEESNNEADDQVPVRTAKHLSEVVGVPAIIGASFSGNTQRASTVTIPSGVLLISPTATSIAITALDDKNLVWRTSPSDVIQVKALLGAMTGDQGVEKLTRNRWNIPTNPIDVWVLHKGDSYGRGLADALERELVFNGAKVNDAINQTHYKRLDYGDPDTNDPPTSYSQKIDEVKAAVAGGKPPHIIFLLGTNEAITELMAPLEADATGINWGADLAKRPTYLYADGGLVSDLWNKVNEVTDIQKRESLRKRILGTVPGTSNANYNAFISLYNSRFSDGQGTIGGTSNTYDALYATAFAIASIPADKPLNGTNIAEGMKRIVGPGNVTTPGSSNINAAFQLLSSGGNIDYDGASGPLQFDPATGDVISDIQIWCIPKDGANVAQPAKNTGAFYDSAAGTVSPNLSTQKDLICP